MTEESYWGGRLKRETLKSIGLINRVVRTRQYMADQKTKEVKKIIEETFHADSKKTRSIAHVMHGSFICRNWHIGVNRRLKSMSAGDLHGLSPLRPPSFFVRKTEVTLTKAHVIKAVSLTYVKTEPSEVEWIVSVSGQKVLRRVDKSGGKTYYERSLFGWREINALLPLSAFPFDVREYVE